MRSARAKAGVALRRFNCPILRSNIIILIFVSILLVPCRRLRSRRGFQNKAWASLHAAHPDRVFEAQQWYLVALPLFYLLTAFLLVGTSVRLSRVAAQQARSGEGACRRTHPIPTLPLTHIHSLSQPPPPSPSTHPSPHPHPLTFPPTPPLTHASPPPGHRETPSCTTSCPPRWLPCWSRTPPASKLGATAPSPRTPPPPRAPRARARRARGWPPPPAPAPRTSDSAAGAPWAG